MNNKNHFNLRKKAVMLGILLSIFLFVSSATAVPQVQGSIVVEKLDDIEKFNKISEILSDDLYLEKINNNIIGLNELFNNKDLSFNEKSVIGSFKIIINKLQSIVDDESSNRIFPNEKEGLLKRVMIVILSLIIIPLMILKGSIKGIAGIFKGIFNIIFSLVKFIFLSFCGIQTILTLIALSMISIGIMSKKTTIFFSQIGAPLIGFIVARMTPAMGSFIGGLIVLIYSIVAILITFAIPLSLVLIVVLVILFLREGEGTAAILSPLLEKIFSKLIDVPGMIYFLDQIWSWFEVNFNDWPSWPFEVEV
jgi:hypothetical protein